MSSGHSRQDMCDAVVGRNIGEVIAVRTLGLRLLVWDRVMIGWWLWDVEGMEVEDIGIVVCMRGEDVVKEMDEEGT